MYSSTLVNVKQVEKMMHNIDAGKTQINCDELICEKQNRLGLITINSPKRRNAINSNMRNKLVEAIRNWVEDPDIYAIMLHSSDDAFFSSGADLKELYEAAKSGHQQALNYFKDEYEALWVIESYTKPVIALINGAVMGGGVGISQYGTHIVAGEKYSWSMPEVKIGLFPDVATSQILAKMPGAIGIYLGLTGREVTRYDAVYLGLLEHCIDENQFETILAALREAEPVDRFLDDMNQSPKSDNSQSPIKAQEPLITKIFSKPTLEEIVTALEALIATEPENKDWAQSVLADLTQASPTSLKVTLNAIQKAKNFTVDQALVQDYKLAHHFLKGHDFIAAIEARLINKTEPNWQPGSLEDVDQAMVEGYFKDNEGPKLDLPSRELGVDK